MSKVVQIPPPNRRFRALLHEAAIEVEEMGKDILWMPRGLRTSGPVDVFEHETDEERARVETGLGPVGGGAFVALVERCREMRGTTATPRLVADGKGRAARELESGRSLDSLAVEAIDRRRVIPPDVRLDASGGEAPVRVLTAESLARDVEQSRGPMRGTWEWLEVGGTA